jgi:hypothetical protein
MQEGGTVQAEQQAHGVGELSGQAQDGVKPQQFPLNLQAQ